uniref:Uncharacterized protein n=1 Tax=Ditylenchus dipsaci TaxID=166011 RepID=A0A915E5Z6_9BILA
MGSVKSKLDFRKLRNDKLESSQTVYCSTDTSLSTFSAEQSAELSNYCENSAPASSVISSNSGNGFTTTSSSRDLESTSDDDSQKLILHRTFATKRNSSGGCEGESLPSTSDSQNNNADISSNAEKTAQSSDSTQDTSDSISSFSTLVGSECNTSLFQPILPKQSDLVWQEAVNKYHQEECGYVIPKLLSDSAAASTMVVDDCTERAQEKVD